MKAKVLVVSPDLLEEAKRFIFEDREVPIAVQEDTTLPLNTITLRTIE